MTDQLSAIPTNLILGFLGVGKTTAILDLFRQKPACERWAVLVNEFGEVGIDGAMLEVEGAFVREVPGGCMCCVAGLPMQIGLNQLIHRARPDRLFIEPTGLGHPSRILDTLTSEHYQNVLTLGPVLTLVDPRKLEDPRVLENVQFRDQVAAADILVANKTDLCSAQQLAAFDRWASELEPAKQHVFHTRQGRLAPAWLDGRPDARDVSTPHAHHHHTVRSEPAPPDIQDQPWQLVTNEGQGHFSFGWRVHPDYRFDENQLMALAGDERIVRFKAVVNTDDGWRVINMADGALSAFDSQAREMSRIELISAGVLKASEMDQAVRAAAGLSSYDE
ncbi:GTPase, G3E family [Marinobacter persicus]|uniref:GTPase, G3E family n=1 Tax=Marinobacter persicus TaxID=930118 RepID=A0A1I3RRV3_9GAMM|nr:GTP-binding protein [Marinobacter persicus]GHD44160.1 GTPase [Marinobacter persicus]SFJ48011.1 GTPase, G3E family [Marinobacter persicus]